MYQGEAKRESVVAVDTPVKPNKNQELPWDIILDREDAHILHKTMPVRIRLWASSTGWFDFFWNDYYVTVWSAGNVSENKRIGWKIVEGTKTNDQKILRE